MVATLNCAAASKDTRRARAHGAKLTWYSKVPKRVSRCGWQRGVNFRRRDVAYTRPEQVTSAECRKSDGRLPCTNTAHHDHLESPPPSHLLGRPMRRLARTESYHTPHTYFGERARIKRSPTFTVLFFWCREGEGGDMIVTRSENYVPGLVFSPKHHNLYRTVRGRTLGYELVFLFYLFCFISFFFPFFLDGVKRRLDTSAESTRWSEHCI